MAISHEFEYARPKTVKEAVGLLKKHQSNAAVLAGGTDLTVKLKETEFSPEILVDIKGISSLAEIKKVNNLVSIGATVTFSELIESKLIKKELPLLWEASNTVASIGTRNRATLAGNICSAVPSLDSGPALLAYDAEVMVQSAEAERKISIAEWFTGPKKNALKPGEMVVSISIPIPSLKNGTSYIKLGRYRGEDLAQAGLGVFVTIDYRYKIAFCALGPVPVRAFSIEKLLEGKNPEDALIEKAIKMLPNIISPITDIRASKEYRMHIAGVMLKRGIEQAISRMNGEKLELTNILGG